MPDTTEPTAIITRLIATGTTELGLLAAVARQFPNLEPKKFVPALQDAIEQAQRRALRPH
jgi:hypothetical protein